MNEYPVKYAVLRYHKEWDGVTQSGLQLQGDGALTLASVPAPSSGQALSLSSPFSVDLSGIAIGKCDDLYVSDTANNIVAFTDEICGANAVLPGKDALGSALGQFHAPRGLLIGPPGGLYVADSGNGRIQVFRLPTLELHEVWDFPLQTPVCLATDGQDRVYVLDRRLQRVMRFDAWGVPDSNYNAAMAQQPSLASPFSLAVGAHDVLYVSDDQANLVLSFDSTGKALGSLPTTNLASPVNPRTLAAQNDTLYVADASTGQIWIYNSSIGAYVGPAANFVGPVSAMALDPAGTTLYVKTGYDQSIVKLQIGAARILFGTLVTGPLDAGESCEWERVHVSATIPVGTNVSLLIFATSDPTKVPGTNDWVLAPALDILVPPLPGSANCTPGQKRYLWMQVQLSSNSQQATPCLQQVRADTTSESYLDHLPAVYRKEDLPARFLERWLALFRSQLGDLELLLDDMPRYFDPVTTPDKYLPWLASWLAFEFPEEASERTQRSLLARAHEFYVQRGTPSGLLEFLEVYTGARPHLFEAFRERHIWQLGISSALGFDTALAASGPNGVIVGGLAPPNPNYFGLEGDYYSGPNLDAFKFTRTDPNVDFNWAQSAPDSSITTPGYFSVEWTGQIQPRYSETYTFSSLSSGGVRLWIDDELNIDTLLNPQTTVVMGVGIPMTAGRWYKIRVEYSRNANLSNGSGSVHLFWSSRSQVKEIVPQSRLYAVLDNTVNLDVPPQTPGCGTLLVGQYVVGETRPLQTTQFGTPLYCDTADLFTVSLPAARVPRHAQRQELRRVIEAEKPAHTDFHLCFIEPRMRVGFQARVGIDSIVGGPAEPMSLTGSVLGLESVLGSGPAGDDTGRVGKHARVGQDTVLG